MIIVGVTWGDRVYMEMVCDCRYCSSHKYKRKAIFIGDTFEECTFRAKKADWLVLRSDRRCYCPHHHKYNRKS